MSIPNNDKDKLINPVESEISEIGAEESKEESTVKKESAEDLNTLINKNYYQNYLIAFIFIVVIVGLIVYFVNTSNDNSDMVDRNLLTSSNLLLLILSLLSLVSISISFWLYYWRKLIIGDKEIMVPESFERNIQSINKVANNNFLNIEKTLDNQTSALKSSRKRSDDVNDEISRISEVISHLQNALEKKDEEMERFKKGYDADIYHKFLLRFTRVDKVLKEYIGEGSIDLDGLEDIHIQMEDALLECGVESFSPEIGKSYKSQNNIEDNPKRIPTTDKDQHEMVAEVYRMGYLRRCEDSSIEIISKAKVVVYDYSEPEKNDNSNEKIEE